jgi:UDP-GlcNAc:undecaprenyl-phosphate GlcNAc-1-phosphate transferase
MLTALIMVLVAAGYSGNDMLAERTMVLVGALIGFLLFNFRFPGRRRALAFMGNSGSALLGLVVAWACFRLTQNEGHPVSPVLALWLAPVPVVDCLVLIVRRLMAGRSPFSADHDHIHHILRDAGFGPMSTALGLAVFTGLCGLVIGQCLRWNVAEPLLLAAYGVLLLFWFGLTTKRARAVAFFRVARFWGRFLPPPVQASPETLRNQA